MMDVLDGQEVAAARGDVAEVSLDELAAAFPALPWPPHDDGRIQTAATLTMLDIEAFAHARWSGWCRTRGVALRALFLARRIRCWRGRGPTAGAVTALEYMEELGHEVRGIDGASFTLIINGE